MKRLTLSTRWIIVMQKNWKKPKNKFQIFNKNDPCCFSGNGYESYEFFIKDKISKLGKGNFQIFIDDTHNEHKISDTALEYIAKNIG